MPNAVATLLKPPFRADHVGSLLRPAKLKKAREELLGVHGSDTNVAPHDNAQLRAIEDECIREVIAMQERVGLRAATDGELRRRSWLIELILSWQGISVDRTGNTRLRWRNQGEPCNPRPRCVPRGASPGKRARSSAPSRSLKRTRLSLQR